MKHTRLTVEIKLWVLDLTVFNKSISPVLYVDSLTKRKGKDPYISMHASSIKKSEQDYIMHDDIYAHSIRYIKDYE